VRRSRWAWHKLLLLLLLLVAVAEVVRSRGLLALWSLGWNAARWASRQLLLLLMAVVVVWAWVLAGSRSGLV